MNYLYSAVLPRKQKTKSQELAASLTIQSFGYNMLQIFVPLYIMGLGHSFRSCVTFMMLLPLTRLIVNYGYYSLAKIRVKLMLVISYLVWAASLVVLTLADGSDTSLAVGLILFGMAYEIYWNSRHLISTRSFSRRALGRNIGSVMTMIYLASVAAPFIGGYVGDRWGLKWATLLAGGVILGAIYPLLFSADSQVTSSVRRRAKAPLAHRLAFLSASLETKSLNFLWPIFLYLLLGSFKKVGLVYAASMLVTVVVTQVASLLSDQRRGQLPVRLGIWLGVMINLSRFLVTSLGLAYLYSVLTSLAQSLKQAPLTRQYYLHAKNYGIASYINLLERWSIVGSFAAWASVYGFSYLVQPKTAILLTFGLVAIIGPAQMGAFKRLKKL